MVIFGYFCREFTQFLVPLNSATSRIPAENKASFHIDISMKTCTHEAAETYMFLQLHKDNGLSVQCTMCTLYSTIALWSKPETQKPFSQNKKKWFLRLLFLYSWRMKTLKLVSLFIFWHYKHALFLEHSKLVEISRKL